MWKRVELKSKVKTNLANKRKLTSTNKNKDHDKKRKKKCKLLSNQIKPQINNLRTFEKKDPHNSGALYHLVAT